jgi:hypothetical protein
LTKKSACGGGNWTTPTKEDIYSGVIGMDTVQLGFAIGSMHALQVCAADIGNVFLYGKTKELVYVIAGPEFGTHEGKTLIIDKGLYALRSSAARFHEHLAAKLRSMGFRPSKADSDLWSKRQDGHYEYIATYVDDILAFSKDPMKLIQEVKKDYVLKGIGTPEYYLGGNVDETDDPMKALGIETSLSAKTYIKSALDRMYGMFDGGPFPKCNTPMMEAYHPEIEVTPLLDDTRASKYRAMIGSANWIVTLGRLDVAYATNCMARFSMAPREGHMMAMKRLFGYLRKFPDGEILVDPTKMDHSPFDGKKETFDTWRECYPDAEQDIPDDQPTPGTKKAQITVFVDADHAHDVVTRRSVTGIILFINNTPVRWLSKRQKTVETSTYGSEVVAGRIAAELVLEYWYALRLLGVEVDGPAMMFGDNNAVIISTSIPSSQLKKKHNACAFHRIRECVAMKVIDFMHIPSVDNLADVLTKPFGGITFHRLVGPMLFRRHKLLAYGKEWQALGSSRCILGEKLNQGTTVIQGPAIPTITLLEPSIINIDVTPATTTT